MQKRVFKARLVNKVTSYVETISLLAVFDLETGLAFLFRMSASSSAFIKITRFNSTELLVVW